MAGVTGTDTARWDALRFHVCLLWEGGRPPVLDESELADTVQLILIDQLETWADRLLGSLAGPAADTAVVPPHADGPGGIAGRLLWTAVPDLGRWLSPNWFRPDLAASVLAETATAARRDLRRLNSAPLLRPAVRGGWLTAHLDLLAALSVAARPMMPGWSAFVARHLGVRTDAQWPPRPGTGGRLLTPGRRLPTGLPVYFRCPTDGERRSNS
jgi:methionyl-tRNA synthetase